MAAADELLVVHGQQGAGGGQELGVENNLMRKEINTSHYYDHCEATHWMTGRTDGWEVRWIHFALNRMGYFIWFDSFYDKDAVMERPWLCRCGRWRGRCGGCCSGWGPSSRPACCEWSLEGECVSVWMKNTRGRNRQSIRALIHEWDDRHETSNTMKLDWTDTYKHR